MSKIACNRLQKELAEWQVNPPVGFKHKVTDNLQRYFFVFLALSLRLLFPATNFVCSFDFENYLFVIRWIIDVNGAPETLYAGETYQLQVDFPEHYPMEAPQVAFWNFH